MSAAFPVPTATCQTCYYVSMLGPTAQVKGLFLFSDDDVASFGPCVSDLRESFHRSAGHDVRPFASLRAVQS